MNEEIHALKERINDLENQVDSIRTLTAETLQLISNHFSTELEKVMIAYREELKLIVKDLISDQRQQ
ncbi:hypothetical protein P0100_18490 [Yersinia pestis]|uniref:hypothetical protein n=1 Tax=Paenibacillus lautus TaxID=1401 RepID=UPI00255E7624|nr:hypothetical protein [Paenibacillus lautus]MDL1163027.1 hypothetical protein [Yersinia pestis]MEC0257709.1 hypothetical protein [Paenibacillus lautus]